MYCKQNDMLPGISWLVVSAAKSTSCVLICSDEDDSKIPLLAYARKLSKAAADKRQASDAIVGAAAGNKTVSEPDSGEEASDDEVQHQSTEQSFDERMYHSCDACLYSCGSLP